VSSAEALALISPGAEGGLGEAARSSGCTVRTLRTPDALLEALDGGRSPAFILVSLGVDGAGRPFLERVRRAVGRSIPIVVSTPRLSLDGAILARESAHGSILPEPIDAGALAKALSGARGAPVGIPLEPASTPVRPGGIIAASPAMAGVLDRLAELGGSSVHVLVRGEPGTGKELLAQALHSMSRRRTGPFVSVNCAAIPERLLEVELFGHERGAFPGSPARKIGRIERAEGGTLFVDEVGELPPILQARFLRVLEERRIERIGGEHPVPVDVRMVAATDRDLEPDARDGSFRRDLLSRLSAVQFEVPPLRERRPDLLPLALHFARHFAERYRREMEGITEEAVRLLETHSWPGNVRELRNVMDRAVLRSRTGWIDAADLGLETGAPRISTPSGADAGYPPTRSLAEVERDHIRKVLRYTRGAMGQAAEVLGIHRNTLTRKVDQYELRDDIEGGGEG
jgi:DNA-binding NtrC family response regulator